eukprot:6381931-Prymnesium_polylepis.1
MPLPQHRRAAIRPYFWVAKPYGRALAVPSFPGGFNHPDRGRPAYEVEKLNLSPRDALEIPRVLVRSH